MTGKQVIKLLINNGWKLERISGSHHIMNKDGVKRPLPVPVHGNKDIPLGTLNKILKEAGLK
jgi:predicted RNA binding protein YcfA (HicA-like mRNA interferase family)